MSTPIWKQPGTLAEQFWKNGKLDFPVYDMHGHMGSHYAIHFYRHTPELMAEHLRKAGVKHLAFSHHHVIMGNMRNAAVAEICKRFPDLYRMYVGIVPAFPENIKEDLAMFDQWTPYAIGLKFLPDYYRIPVTDKRWEPALKFADERKLPILVHTWGSSQYDGGPVMLEVAQKYPNAKFFLGHSLYGNWEYAERLVKETNNNVWLELTAIPGERKNIEMLVEKVGSERILFGTDLPWFDEFQGIGGVLSADISDDDKRNILCRNAETILGKDW